MASERSSIVVAEDHEAMRSYITNLLQPGYNVIAAVGDGVLAVEAVIECHPDVAILDISLPRMNGFDVGRKIRELGLPTKIVFMSAEHLSAYLEFAQSLTAGYVLKNRLNSDLPMAIEEVLAGRTFGSMISFAKTPP
jgi:DNA-binding NarL/FixJ family response regulator